MRALAPWSGRLRPVESVAARERLAYRDRVALTARWDETQGWRFGLMRRDELIAIHDCPVHTPRVNALVRLLTERLPPFAQLQLAYLHVAGAQATLIVKTRTIDPRVLDEVVQGVATTGIEGLWVHCHPAAGRRMFARSGWTLVWGRPRSRDPAGLAHGPAAFQQLLPGLHANALECAAQHLAPGAATSVLDLYCGIGASMRRWRAGGASVLGIELAGGAVECAADNAPGCGLLRGTCAQRLPQIRDWWRQQPGTRQVYANPPRSGLEREVVTALVHDLRPAQVACLSCSAGTLARDLEALEAGGYDVLAIQPYDFFPLTHHVETLALLSNRVR
jgi:tRNA/tmRNA/rRNA uracil-C5-methylase (TrmA/RlmC/RlmD family)